MSTYSTSWNLSNVDAKLLAQTNRSSDSGDRSNRGSSTKVSKEGSEAQDESRRLLHVDSANWFKIDEVELTYRRDHEVEGYIIRCGSSAAT